MRPKITKEFKPDYFKVKDYERPYFNIPHEVWDNDIFQKFSWGIQKFYVHLCRLSNTKADKEGWFYRKMKDLQQETKLSLKTIQKAKNLLEKNHFIDIGQAYYKDKNIHYSDCFRVNGFKEIIIPDDSK